MKIAMLKVWQYKKGAVGENNDDYLGVRACDCDVISLYSFPLTDKLNLVKLLEQFAVV